MCVKLSEPLKKWAYKTLFLLDSFCRCEVLGGATQQIKGILLGTMSGHPLGVHSSNFTFAEFGQG